MSVILGVAGAVRNAAMALCDSGHVAAVCEQERLTRTRRAPLRKGLLPLETLETVLRLGGREKREISSYAVAESAIDLPRDLCVERLDHHFAHAAISFYTSPFDDAIVLVCDRHGDPELTVWRGDAAQVKREEFPWTGTGFARVYSQAAEALGFPPEANEYRVEALAHVAERGVESVGPLVTWHGDHLNLAPHFRASVASLIASNGHAEPVAHSASIAAGIQQRLGQLLLEALKAIKSNIGGHNLCLAGGLFYNSYFNTLVAQSGLYDHTFVPINPGNAGLAVGAALATARKERPLKPSCPLSPFLGPEYDSVEIKATLDNCKLSYDYLRDTQLIERTATALANGQLIGWFQGRMEWGPRALGNRSILASPVAPYVLENLNAFLKQREPHRSYSVSICEEDVQRYFSGPATSRCMEYEYEVLDPALLHALLPLNATRLRVQTVPESAGIFHRLIRAFGHLTGVPMLVNTSFNGFHEPIVCTPRDAVRVFFGTGLDMAVIGSWVLRK